MSKKFLVGFITGTVAGTITGLLLASDKGSAIRHTVSAKIKDYLNKVKRSLVSDDNAGEMPEWEQAERPYTANKG